MAKQHSFIFPTEQIRTLVEKRTTMLGANRDAEGVPHLVERLSMTKGEGFLFEDYLPEAVAETYNWIRAFGRNVKEAFRIYPNGEIHTVKTNDGVHIEVEGEKSGLRWVQEIGSTTSPLLVLEGVLSAANGSECEFGTFNLYGGALDGSTSGYRFLLTTSRRVELVIDGHWVRNLGPDDETSEGSAWWDSTIRLNPGEVYTLSDSLKDFINSEADWVSEIRMRADAQDSAAGPTQVRIEIYAPENNSVTIPIPSVNVCTGDAQGVDYEIIIHHTVGVPGSPISNQCEYAIPCHITSDTEISSPIEETIPVSQVDGLGLHIAMLSVDSIEVVVRHIDRNPIAISKGDYVKVIGEDGSSRLGIALSDYDSTIEGDALIVDETATDVRNTVVMRVELPEWQDDNMLPAVHNHLQEAIVNYIIWRWFETVNPREADIYYKKWETKAHEAQLGLNAEKRTLQRKSTWL